MRPVSPVWRCHWETQNRHSRIPAELRSGTDSPHAWWEQTKIFKKKVFKKVLKNEAQKTDLLYDLRRSFCYRPNNRRKWCNLSSSWCLRTQQLYYKQSLYAESFRDNNGPLNGLISWLLPSPNGVSAQPRDVLHAMLHSLPIIQKRLAQPKTRQREEPHYINTDDCCKFVREQYTVQGHLFSHMDW